MTQQDTQHVLTCPLCGGENFKEEKGRLESQWGQSEHKADMRICEQCGYILLFSKGKAWFLLE